MTILPVTRQYCLLSIFFNFANLISGKERVPLKKFLLNFRKKGRKRENIYFLPPTCPLIGIEPATHACGPDWKSAGNLLVHRRCPFEPHQPELKGPSEAVFTCTFYYMKGSGSFYSLEIHLYSFCCCCCSFCFCISGFSYWFVGTLQSIRKLILCHKWQNYFFSLLFGLFKNLTICFMQIYSF